MGKKKKNRNYEWDFTPEDQKRITDDLYALETKGKSIFDIVNVDRAPINDNGVSDDLEELIVRDLSGDPSSVEEADYSYNMHVTDESKRLVPSYEDYITKPKYDVTNELPAYSYNNVENEEMNDSNNISDIVYSSVMNGISFVHDRYLDTVSVTDTLGVTGSNSISVKYISYTPIIPGTWDADELGTIISQLYFYIISCKHPFAVITLKDFEEKFKDIKSVNNDKFVFFTDDNYVFMYYIDKNEGKEELMSIPEFYSLGDTDVLKFFISLAYSAGETNYIFRFDDLEYLSQYISKYSEEKLFMNSVWNDENTKLLEEESTETVSSRLHVLSIKNIQSASRDMIMHLTGEDIDEDEYDDDIDDEEDDIEDDDYTELMGDAEMIDTPEQPVKEMDDKKDTTPMVINVTPDEEEKKPVFQHPTQS